MREAHAGMKEVVIVAVILVGAVVVLFPVFTKAKTGGGPSVMGTLQHLSIPTQLYVEASDGVLPPLGHPGVPWTHLVLPYARMLPIFTLPRRYRPDPPRADELFGHVGYNYAGLNRTSSGKLQGKALASLSHPESLILFTVHASPKVILKHKPTGILYAMSVEPPVCPPDNDLCIGGWGTDFWAKHGGMSTESFPARHGRVDLDRPDQPERGFSVWTLDGRGARFKSAQLAEGTDCAADVDRLAHPCTRTGTGTYRWGEP